MENKERYINLNEAIALTDQHSFEYAYDALWMEEALLGLPTANVKPAVNGRWIDNGKNKPPTCSNCGSGCLLNYESDYHESDYCPHCGKYMGDVEQYSVGAGISQNAIMAKLFLMEDDLK